jgi:hypothetical protein
MVLEDDGTESTSQLESSVGSTGTEAMHRPSQPVLDGGALLSRLMGSRVRFQ